MSERLDSMSELRQRHGGAGAVNTSAGEKALITRPIASLYFGGTKHFKTEEIEDIIRCSVLPRKVYTMPSISNTARKAKDALEADPYNIECIVDLGLVYCAEVQWDLAANVMIRGWKRASDLKDPKDRFSFLMKAAEASFRNKQFRQAHAVLMDIDEPEDYFERKAYQLLACHAYAEIGDAPKAIAIFCKAIEGEEFDSAMKIWAACALRLKKVGGFEAAKNAVMNKARPGPNGQIDQARMQTVESWAIMSGASDDSKSIFSLEDGVQPWMIKAAVAFIISLFIYMLWWLEQRSLAASKLLKP